MSLVLLVTLLGAAPDDADIAARAEARRQHAEAALARGRTRRTEARTELSRKLQEAETARIAARERLARAKATLDGLRTRSEDRERQAARTARTEADLRRLLGQAGDVPADARDGPVDTLQEAALAGVRARMRELDHDTHVHRQRTEVLGRDGRPVTAEVLRLGRIQALALGADGNHTGFATPDATPPLVVGPMLSLEQQAALRSYAQESKSDLLPVDVDGAVAALAPEAAGSEEGGLAAGGAFVWPILGVGLLGLLILAERLWFLWAGRPDPSQLQKTLEDLRSGRREAAVTRVEGGRTDLERVLRAGLRSPHEASGLDERLESALLIEEPRLQRGLSLLGAVAGLAPLLGLLGTVTGMIATFDVISTFGTGNPKLLSGGISVALITTQLGLVVAVPALLAHAWLGRAIGKRQALLERARTELLALAAERDA